MSPIVTSGSRHIPATLARPELVEGRAVWLVVRQACPERAAHPSTGSGWAV